MSVDSWSVAVGSDRVSATYERAISDVQSAVFVCAHGAGGHMSDRGMLATGTVGAYEYCRLHVVDGPFVRRAHSI